MRFSGLCTRYNTIQVENHKRRPLIGLDTRGLFISAYSTAVIRSSARNALRSHFLFSFLCLRSTKNLEIAHANTRFFGPFIRPYDHVLLRSCLDLPRPAHAALQCDLTALAFLFPTAKRAAAAAVFFVFCFLFAGDARGRGPLAFSRSGFGTRC